MVVRIAKITMALVITTSLLCPLASPQSTSSWQEERRDYGFYDCLLQAPPSLRSAGLGGAGVALAHPGSFMVNPGTIAFSGRPMAMSYVPKGANLRGTQYRQQRAGWVELDMKEFIGNSTGPVSFSLGYYGSRSNVLGKSWWQWRSDLLRNTNEYDYDQLTGGAKLHNFTFGVGLRGRTKAGFGIAFKRYIEPNKKWSDGVDLIDYGFYLRLPVWDQLSESGRPWYRQVDLDLAVGLALTNFRPFGHSSLFDKPYPKTTHFGVAAEFKAPGRRTELGTLTVAGQIDRLEIDKENLGAVVYADTVGRWGNYAIDSAVVAAGQITTYRLGIEISFLESLRFGLGWVDGPRLDEQPGDGIANGYSSMLLPREATANDYRSYSVAISSIGLRKLFADRAGTSQNCRCNLFQMLSAFDVEIIYSKVSGRTDLVDEGGDAWSITLSL